MTGNTARHNTARHNTARHVALLFGAALALGACSHRLFHTEADDDDSGVNAFPTNYKADIMAAMHVYLNDPTGIRDAAVSPPVLKEAGGERRYMACVKLNPKKNSTDYAGVRELAAVFLVGRFDHFMEIPVNQSDASKNPCVGAAYAPFPELEKLPP
jgi:hypothetical protein